MSKISKEEFTTLANLARLKFSDKERQEISKDLESILEFVEKLSQADTNKVLPYQSGIFNVWRDDEHEPSHISQKELLANAPGTEDGFIKTKPILE